MASVRWEKSANVAEMGGTAIPTTTMQLSCPICGTRDVHTSRRYGLVELIKGLAGIFPLLCRRCGHRWLTHTWDAYAHCPRCYRQELTTWSELEDVESFRTVALLRLGAVPYRCSACQRNFASFKPCKDRFSWRQRTTTSQEPPPRRKTINARSAGSSIE